MIKRISLIFLLFFLMFQNVSAIQEPTWNEIPPKIQEESKVIHYMMDEIGQWINGNDWVNYNPRIDGSRVKEIAKIIEKYGYTSENYYVRMNSYLNALTREIVYWRIEVIVSCKSDGRYSVLETWTIYLIEIGQGV